MDNEMLEFHIDNIKLVLKGSRNPANVANAQISLQQIVKLARKALEGGK